MNRYATTAIAGALALGLTACQMAKTVDRAGAIAPADGVKAVAAGPGDGIIPSFPGVELAATLAGNDEIPGPGDMKGNGHATVWADTVRDQLCYFLGVDGIETPTVAHIHQGAPGLAGPQVVVLEALAGKNTEGCVNGSSALVASIADNPETYYVNVHSKAFPDGAIRGQLKKVGHPADLAIF